MSGYAAELESVIKRYDDLNALDGVNLAVAEGTVHGLLGPNGAGKTTAVRILATLLQFDAGRALVAGRDVTRDPDAVRSLISLTGQYAAVDEPLSGRQNLVMFGRLFGLTTNAARRRADELLEQFSLTDAANKSVRQYSGGMRRRLDLAASMIRAPYILFLDEPTSGLDPRSRNELWNMVRGLVAQGTTILLTTQYLEEADQLANYVSVIDSGQIVAEGTTDELKHRAGGDRIEVVVHDAADLAVVAEAVARYSDSAADVDESTRRVSAFVADRMTALTDVLQVVTEMGVPVEDIGLRRPTLDEAFLQLTGHRAEQEAHS
jgi:ABC-2 type transport system ATP-binding protein